MQSSSSSIRLYSLPFADARTWLFTILFVAGNIIVPQLCHLIPGGGLTWLPIYFFTLIAAYKYGWKAGLLTAILSPAVNSLLFGMPASAALPAIMLKSVVLAFSAGLLAARFNRAALWQMLVVVVAYQAIGTLGEWLLKADLFLALQDFRIGMPGMAVQVIGGWIFINFLIRK